MSAIKDKQYTVAVAMSGGVDSSVAASLLLDAGYDVIGVTLALWNADDPQINPAEITKRYADAERVAQQLGIPWQLVEMREPFQKTVIGYYTEALKNGITPNP